MIMIILTYLSATSLLSGSNYHLGLWPSDVFFLRRRLGFTWKDLDGAAKKGEGRPCQHLCIWRQNMNGRNLHLRDAVHHHRASTHIF